MNDEDRFFVGLIILVEGPILGWLAYDVFGSVAYAIFAIVAGLISVVAVCFAAYALGTFVDITLENIKQWRS